MAGGGGYGLLGRWLLKTLLLIVICRVLVIFVMTESLSQVWVFFATLSLPGYLTPSLASCWTIQEQ
jgi:hypothetical protein